MSFNFSTFSCGGTTEQRIAQLETQVNSLIDKLNFSLNSLDDSNFVGSLTNENQNIDLSKYDVGMNNLKSQLEQFKNNVALTLTQLDDLTKRVKKLEDYNS